MPIDPSLPPGDAEESEKLRVRDFLTIRDADLEIGRFTLIIGPQASGKSVLAKLLYFFRSLLAREIVGGLEDLSTQARLTAQGVAAFERVSLGMDGLNRPSTSPTLVVISQYKSGGKRALGRIHRRILSSLPPW